MRFYYSFRNDNGVKINIGIEIAINNVCNSVIAPVNATALVAPMNSDKNDPTQVGHAMNNPVAAPMLPSPPVFFVIAIALTAIIAMGLLHDKV